MKTISVSFLFLFFGAPALLFSAAIGDYRSKNSGNWNQASTWQYYNGSAWVNATNYPTYLNGDIEVQAGHSVTVTADVTTDQTSVAGYLTVNSGIILTISDGSSTDLSISNKVFVYGTLRNQGTISSVATELIIYAGGLFQHNKDGSSVADATWNDGSTCEITGILSAGSLSNTDQSFYHFKWNCPAQTNETNLAGNLETIRGNFMVVSTGYGILQMAEQADYYLTISGDWQHTAGTLNLGGSSSNGIIDLKGNFTMQGGKITEDHSNSYYSKIYFSKSGVQSFNRTGGVFENNVDFEIMNGTTLDLGGSVVSGSLGTFSVDGGSTLRTAHAGGIASGGASGCIQTTGRYFSPSAHYHYNANGAQATGNALPSPLSGQLMVGSGSAATHLTLTNGSVTLSNRLILCSSNVSNSTIASGTLVFGSGAVLEYQGMSGQTTASGEWPVVSGPVHVTINNPYGVSMSASRTVSGQLALSQGVFSIGNNLLTLNGTLVQNAGTLSGGCTSRITLAGTSASPVDIPQVTLDTLRINRPGGMRLTGNMTICHALILTQGAISVVSGQTITYQTGGRLIYNGGVNQNTTAMEWPVTGGPSSMEILKPSGALLSLQFSRTLTEALLLSGGNFNIGSNTLTLEGQIISGSGTLTGGITSGLTAGGVSAPLVLPALTLGTLTVSRLSGVDFSNDMIIHSQLILNSGSCRINGHCLTMNGLIQYSGGNLEGGGSSSLIISGTAATISLAPITLGMLQLNRINGLNLTGDIEIEGFFQLVRGSVWRNGYQMYGPFATLSYMGLTGQTTTDEEWPAENGPYTISIESPGQVILHADREISGNLRLMNGQFVLGDRTLAIHGNFDQGMGLIVGGPMAKIIIGEGVLQAFLPEVELGDLVINRTSGVVMARNCTIWQALYLESGDFTIGFNRQLKLMGQPIMGDLMNLKAFPGAGILFGGSEPGFEFPPGIATIGYLEITNPSGVNMASDIEITERLAVSGRIILNARILSGNGLVNIMPGACLVTSHETGISGNIQMTGPPMVDGNVDYEFNGTSDQKGGFLLTTPPGHVRHLTVSNSGTATLTLEEDLTVGGRLTVMPGAGLQILPGIVVEAEEDLVIR